MKLKGDFASIPARMQGRWNRALYLRPQLFLFGIHSQRQREIVAGMKTRSKWAAGVQ